jgi:hypothetical protein
MTGWRDSGLATLFIVIRPTAIAANPGGAVVDGTLRMIAAVVFLNLPAATRNCIIPTATLQS